MPSASSKMPNLSGTTLSHRYELIRILGSGSFGVVYGAVDLQAPPHEAARAIKLVSKEGLGQSGLDAVRTEMALHKRVSGHPNIVTLHDGYEDGTFFVFVLDYCPGGDLAEFLAAHGGKSYSDEQKLRKAYLALLDAVEYMHAQGVYHRDLKPANILVNKDGSELFIADFGLASDMEVYDHGCGTPAYMPPECLRKDTTGDRSGRQTDIWALGLILLNMVSAIMPWTRAVRKNELYAKFVADPSFLPTHLPITPGANRIIRRLLRANPHIRASITTARRMVEELDAFHRPAGESREAGRVEFTSNEMRSTVADELEIQILNFAPNTRARQLEKQQTKICADRSCSSSGSSGKATPMVVTPESSVVFKGDRGKKVIGQRVRSLVARFTRRTSA